MAGIYIHIPFCKQACHYCNFHFSTTMALKDDLVSCLLMEIQLRAQAADPGIQVIHPADVVETIYFGGGTPSLLSGAQLEALMRTICENYKIADTPEVTLEANPDDITEENLTAWKNAGINRLSIGIQSFVERDLKWMNRAHNAEQAFRSIDLARNAGIPNLSVDLIFGTPGLTDAELKENIRQVTDRRVPHVACYALTVEPRTALNKMIELKKKDDVDPDNQARQFMLLMEEMEMAGYEQYEISNFALPRYRSRHNSSYWQGGKYLGIGPSAHSFDGFSRQWNVANNPLYIQSIRQRTIPAENEFLSEKDRVNEYIMTSIRTMEGIRLSALERLGGIELRERIEQIFETKIQPHLYHKESDAIVLTPAGRLLGDALSVTLFL